MSFPEWHFNMNKSSISIALPLPILHLQSSQCEVNSDGHLERQPITWVHRESVSVFPLVSFSLSIFLVFCLFVSVMCLSLFVSKPSSGLPRWQLNSQMLSDGFVLENTLRLTVASGERCQTALGFHSCTQPILAGVLTRIPLQIWISSSTLLVGIKERMGQM